MHIPPLKEFILRCARSLDHIWLYYRKNPKISDTQKFAVIPLKVEQDGFSLEKCTQKMQPELQTV